MSASSIERFETLLQKSNIVSTKISPYSQTGVSNATIQSQLDKAKLAISALYKTSESDLYFTQITRMCKELDWILDLAHGLESVVVMYTDTASDNEDTIAVAVINPCRYPGWSKTCRSLTWLAADNGKMIGDVNLDSFMVSHMEHIAREAGKRLVVELPNDSQENMDRREEYLLSEKYSIIGGATAAAGAPRYLSNES